MARKCLILAVICLTSLSVWAQDEAAGKPAPKWKSEVELGYSGSRGPTLSDSLRIAANSALKTELHRWKLDASYNFATSDGKESKNDATAGVLKDWLIPETPWFGFGDARYDFDEFGSWNHRFSGHVGGGYDLLRTKPVDATLRVGLGAFEALEDEETTQYEALLGGEITWRVKKGMEAGAKTMWYPALNADSFGKHYRAVSSAYWKLHLSAFEAMSVKFAVDHEYESNVTGEKRHHDTKIYAAVVMSF